MIKITTYIQISYPNKWSTTFNWEWLEFPLKTNIGPFWKIERPQYEKLWIKLEESSSVSTPVYKNENCCEPEIDLLLYRNHYSLTTKLHTQLSRTKNRTGYSNHVCRRCLDNFSAPQTLDHHMEGCTKHEQVKLVFSTLIFYISLIFIWNKI